MLTSEEVDAVLNAAIFKCLTKVEIIKSLTTSSSIDIPQAKSVVRCVPSVNTSSGADFSVWDFMAPQSSVKKDFYFTTDRKLLLRNVPGACYVEYVVDSRFLTIEDLSDYYLDWSKRYAIALLSIKEGYAETRAILTALPFEFNYQQLKDDGNQAKIDLEQELEDMFFGCFSVKG